MKVERSNPPQNNGEIKFHLPKFKRFKLNNGMDVLFLQKNHLPIVKISLQVNCGSKFDPKGKSGLAFLTSHLISEGAGEYNSLQLDEEIELLGTLFDPSTDNDIINLSMITLSDKFDEDVIEKLSKKSFEKDLLLNYSRNISLFTTIKKATENLFQSGDKKFIRIINESVKEI